MEKPPRRAIFIEADDLDKVLLMTNAWIRQTKRVQECNASLDILQEWKASILNTLPEDAEVSTSSRWERRQQP